MGWIFARKLLCGNVVYTLLPYHNHVGFTNSVSSSSHHPCFSSSLVITSTCSAVQITQELILYNPQYNEKYKMSQPHINDNINSFNTNQSFDNVWNNCTVADEDSGILAWLSPLEPQIRHHDIRTRRVDEVGRWLLQTEEYRNWFGGIGGGSALFCYGGQGVGKTYIW